VTTANQAKGAAWERDIRTYLTETLGRHVVRRPRNEGFKDVGDIHVSPFVLQAKNVAAITLSAFVEAAEAQAVNADEPFGVAVVKRRGKGAADGYVVMSLRTFRRVLTLLYPNQTQEH